MQFDAIIPAAGCGQRMGTKGPKALISLGGETVIQRQIRLLREMYENIRIVVVGGYKHEKLFKSLPRDTGFVWNQDFLNTNVSASIQLGLAFTRRERASLVVYGDLVFTSATLPSEWPDGSSIIADSSDSRPDEIGVTANANKAINFAFGLPTKWSHIALLDGSEKAMFAKECHGRPRLFGYEILNRVIGVGGHINLIFQPDMKLVEIDTPKDVLKARELVNENPV